MEKYHSRPPCVLSTSPPPPPCPGLLITVFGSRVTPQSRSPRKNRWTLTKALVQQGPELVRPAARSSAQCAFRVYPNTPGQLLGKDDIAATFKCKSIWCLCQWQEDSGRSGTTAESRSLVGVTGGVYARRYRSGWPSTHFHGCAEQLSPMMVCLLSWALLRCSLYISTAHTQPGDHCERDTMGAQPGTALWFIIGESHSDSSMCVMRLAKSS